MRDAAELMDITLVYFVYGLAFFSMGLAMLFESGRSPLLAEARALRPLAVFGLVHGTHEWLEMFLDKSEWLVFNYPVLIAWLRVGVLTLSFTSLVVFALRMMQPQRQPSRRVVATWIIGISLYTLIIVAIGLWLWRSHLDRLSHLDAMVRYLIAVPGAALAGGVLHQQASDAYRQGRRELGLSLRLAAWGFIIYALTQAVVPPIDVFPGRILNTQTFIKGMGFPIQVVRAVVAILITVGLIRATQVVEQERQAQFLAARKARLEALEQVQHELEAREALRQELLRHTVIAQEEERSRIARELHDETAQILTAFGLHLAALNESVSEDSQAGQQINKLQTLRHQMARGIYRMMHDLRPAQLDDLGLIAALQQLSDESRERLNLLVSLEIQGQRKRLPSLVETVFYRVAQEALTNVSRHAGVDEASLLVLFEPDDVMLRVSDQGKGFNVDISHQLTPRGWGLPGMAERAESVGGRLKLESIPGEGTTVEVIIPAE